MAAMVDRNLDRDNQDKSNVDVNTTYSMTDPDTMTTEGEKKEDECDRDAFIKSLTDIVPHEKIVAIRQEQAKMLQVLEVCNWKLASLNEVSEDTFQRSVADFRQKTKMLSDMKKQLDSIFRRIRHLKAQVAVNYPEAYAAAKAKYDTEIDDDFS